MGSLRELDNLRISYFKGILKVPSWIFQYLKGFFFLWSFLANKWNIKISGILKFLSLYMYIFTGCSNYREEKQSSMYRKHNVDDRQKQELGILQTHRLQNASHEDPNGWVSQRWLESYLFLIESTVHIFKKKMQRFKIMYMYM